MQNHTAFAKVTTILETIFLCLFSFYAILGSNNLTYGSTIISYVMVPTFLLGIFIIGLRLLQYKNYIKMPGFFWLIALLASVGVSTLINFQYSFKSNLVFCIYWAFFFLICYLTDKDTSVSRIKKSTEIVATVYVVFSLVCAVISLYMMATGVTGKVVVPETGYEYYRGFSIGRLWGVYINPNNGAITSAIAALILLYFIFTKKAVWKRILCFFAVFLELMFIALSDSRSGAVCLGGGLAVFFLVVILNKLRDKSIIFKSLAVACAAVIAVVGFAIPRKLKDGYKYVAVQINELIAQQDPPPNTNPEEEGGENTEQEKNPPVNVVDRGYDTSGDISNRRFDVWKGGFELFADSPRSILFGYSFKGFTEQAKEVQPDNYLVDNDYAQFTTLDNEVVNILVSQGLFGIVAFGAFVVAILIFCFKRLFKLKKEKQLLSALLVAVLFGLSLSAMFGSVMFYHLSVNTVLFWCFLGYLVHMLNKAEKEQTNEQ